VHPKPSGLSRFSRALVVPIHTYLDGVAQRDGFHDLNTDFADCFDT
jgi:hypothetical protein